MFNTMSPDQTAPKGSDLGPYCLQFRLPKNIVHKIAGNKNHEWQEKTL